VRDTAQGNSDVDILVAFDGPATSERYFGVQFYLEDLFGCPVDLVTEHALRPELRALLKRKPCMSDAARREWRFYLDDMIRFAEKVLAYTDGLNQSAFVSVQAKASSAARWCGHASDHAAELGTKPWKYLLLAHDQIAESKRLSDYLRFEVKR